MVLFTGIGSDILKTRTVFVRVRCERRSLWWRNVIFWRLTPLKKTYLVCVCVRFLFVVFTANSSTSFSSSENGEHHFFVVVVEYEAVFTSPSSSSSSFFLCY